MQVSDTSTVCTYTIDAKDRILQVDDNWGHFARQNRGHGIAELQQVLGKSLFDFIGGREARYLYRTLLEKVREYRQETRFPSRCDSPARRRFLEMIIRPLARGEIGFTTILQKEEPRQPIALLNPAVKGSGTLVQMCSMCKKIQVSDDECEEIEIEIAIDRLELFGEPHPPQITHGVCPCCYQQIMKSW